MCHFYDLPVFYLPLLQPTSAWLVTGNVKRTVTEWNYARECRTNSNTRCGLWLFWICIKGRRFVVVVVLSTLVPSLTLSSRTAMILPLSTWSYPEEQKGKDLTPVHLILPWRAERQRSYPCATSYHKHPPNRKSTKPLIIKICSIYHVHLQRWSMIFNMKLWL